MRVSWRVINPVFPLLLVLGLCILPFTAAATGSAHQAGSITETDQERAVESNATVEITGVTVNESVFRAGDTALVWRTGPNGSNATEQRIDVALSAGASDDHVVCLGTNRCEPAQNRSGGQTVSFSNVSLPADRTTINVTLRRAPDGVPIDGATPSVWRIAREHDLDRDGVRNEREVAAGTSLVLDDTDRDGLTDERELALGTDPTVVDTDGDGLDDAREAELGTDPTATDTDGDGLGDVREIELGLDPSAADTDGDGLDDAREIELGTDPTVVDTDDDGLDDARERSLGANATAADTDGDGLDDGREVALGATLTTGDTDGDGLADGREAELGTDPTATDTDGDGLGDVREIELGTDPTAADTDGDGLADGREAELGTDPTATDTDGDGLDDAREVALKTAPTAADTDDDGLIDAREIDLDTDPTAVDTDGDSLEDGTERELGFDPTNPYTPALYGSGILGFVLGIGVAVSAMEDGPVAWLRSLVPAAPGRRPTALGSADVSDPAPDPVRADPDDPDDHADRDGPEETDGSTAREVFERHQDALVTDAERTLRMLEVEDGQMRQSTIVESTSWSKAKVSRLLSRMDDDDEIVKVSIGRENLICLPEETPEPARPTDRGAMPSTRLVGTATSG